MAFLARGCINEVEPAIRMIRVAQDRSAGAIGRAMPRVSFVEVDMGIDEAGKNERTGGVEFAHLRGGGRIRGEGDGNNFPPIKREIAEDSRLQRIDGRRCDSGGKQGDGHAGAANEKHGERLRAATMPRETARGSP